MQNSGSGQDAKKRTTFIEEGSAFKGEFSSDCPIVVKGRIEGNITGPSLTVSATGAVNGVVKVGVIECEGELAGQFEADVVRLLGDGRERGHPPGFYAAAPGALPDIPPSAGAGHRCQRAITR